MSQQRAKRGGRVLAPQDPPEQLAFGIVGVYRTHSITIAFNFSYASNCIIIYVSVLGNNN